MKKLAVLLMIVTVFATGCAKKGKEVPPSPQQSPEATVQVSPAPSAEKSPEIKKSEPDKSEPTMQDLEGLTDKLEKTTDEQERREILDKIQIILEKAEAKN